MDEFRDIEPLLRAGNGFDLGAVDTASTPGFDHDGKHGKKQGHAALAEGAVELADLQEKLYAQGLDGDQRRILLVLQAMDTAGKGGIVGHVVGSVNPYGMHIAAFKAPTDEEKAHDFLWRIRKQLPAAGMLGVFDRSHYEDVLVHRVRHFSTPEVIEKRYGLINDFEKEISDAGTTIIKVMLHISPAEQKSRLEARLDESDRGRLKVGQGATVKIEAVPGKDFAARVNLISVLARVDFSSGWPPVRNFDLGLVLDERDPRIRPGMTATARIAADRMPDMTLVPAEAIFQKDGRPIVYKLNGSKFDEQQIEIVRRGREQAAVSAGVAVGDKLAVRRPQPDLVRK